MRRAGAAPADDYNLLPYPSLPFAYSQPAHMAAMARLYGLAPPAPDFARVLELGCASGGNIIPLAARFPAAHFTGIDLSDRHVARAQGRIGRLGLLNVDIQQADLVEARLAGCEFDYVICHGVFSWVSRSAQDAILRICRDVLAPTGIAAISYNVLPGWHLRAIVRDICLLHAGDDRSPRDRVAEARRALERIAGSSSEREPYGVLLRSEARRLAQLPDAYILGEFLAAENTPCHFREFVARAESYGLNYLSEGDLASSISDTLFPDTQMRTAAGEDRLGLEQHKDLVSGRPFRRSLLAKARGDTARAQPSPDRMRSLHCASNLVVDISAASESAQVYRDERGRAIKTREPAVSRALARLAETYPATLPLTDLADHADDDAVKKVSTALLTLAAAGQASLSALPLDVGRENTSRPCLWPLARAEAADAQPWVTSLRHEAVALSKVATFLSRHLDGTRDRAWLHARLLGAVRDGRLPMPDVDLHTEGAQDLVVLTAQLVDHAIRDLARDALLAPATACEGRPTDVSKP